MQVVALFSPEHGLTGSKDENVASTKDPASGLPIYSLYGETRRPTEEMLAGIDALVFDMQDAGVRFYTYTTTMAYCMEEAAKHKIAFFVLDRPESAGRRNRGRADAGCGQDQLHRLFSAAGALRADDRRAGAII